MTTLTYTPMHGSPLILDAKLGEITVGGIYGKEWRCNLPGHSSWNWIKTRSADKARAALEQAVTDWLARAGLKQTAGFATEADAWAASGARG